RSRTLRTGPITCQGKSMKLSLKWLRDYVDVTLPPVELAHRLTMAGTEVGGIQNIGGEWEGVRIGRVVAIDRHPNADRLVLATVDLGGETQTVVTGAPNIAAGQVVPFARVGARLLDGHSAEKKWVTLKPQKIRGVESQGMVCSEKELGLSDEHEGILVLPDDAPVGRPLAGYLGDTIFDLELTPNRPDCQAVLGVAREVAAIENTAVREPELSYPEAAAAITGRARVSIEAPDLCPRYCAALIENVQIGPS